ncbi:MAG: hypothetical protein H7177_14865 [Rhizobacter sp.]|nr:hypothetical protein [Bacteriovorax sp.]
MRAAMFSYVIMRSQKITLRLPVIDNQNIQTELQKNKAQVLGNAKSSESKVSKSATKKDGNDIENRDARAPSGEAGLHDRTTERAFNDTMKSGSPERRLNSNYAKVESNPDMAREQNDERLASPSRIHVSDFPDTETEEEIQKDSEKADIKFTTPDEFYPSQDPSPSREDITLGRNTSSATKISTAKAAPISSEVSTDAKRKS